VYGNVVRQDEVETCIQFIVRQVIQLDTGVRLIESCMGRNACTFVVGTLHYTNGVRAVLILILIY